MTLIIVCLDYGGI